jgi:hypothetical protein
MNFWRRAATVSLTALAATLASVGTLAVTAAGFTLSFDAIRAVAVAAHIRQSWAWMMPVAVDGSMAVATVVAIVLYKITGKHRIYPWVVLTVGILVSMASNGLHATGEAGQPITLDWRVRVAVATVPAVMLALSFHLLATLVSIVSERVSKAEDIEDKLSKIEGDPVLNARSGQDSRGLTFFGQDTGQSDDLSRFTVPSSVQMSQGFEDTQDLSKDDVQEVVDKVHEKLANDLGQEIESYLSRLSTGQDSVQPVPVQTEDKPSVQSPKSTARSLSPTEIGQVRDLMSWGRAAGLSKVTDLRTWVAEQYGVSAKTIQRVE